MTPPKDQKSPRVLALEAELKRIDKRAWALVDRRERARSRSEAKLIEETQDALGDLEFELEQKLERTDLPPPTTPDAVDAEVLTLLLHAGLIVGDAIRAGVKVGPFAEFYRDLAVKAVKDLRGADEAHP